MIKNDRPHQLIRERRAVRPEMALADFIVPLEILEYGEEQAEKYGRIRCYLEHQGEPIRLISWSRLTRMGMSIRGLTDPIFEATDDYLKTVLPRRRADDSR